MSARQVGNPSSAREAERCRSASCIIACRLRFAHELQAILTLRLRRIDPGIVSQRFETFPPSLLAWWSDQSAPDSPVLKAYGEITALDGAAPMCDDYYRDVAPLELVQRR